MQALGQAIAQVAALTYAADVLPQMVAPGDAVRIVGARQGFLIECEPSVTVTFQATGYEAVQCFEVWLAERYDGSVSIYGEW